MKTIKTLFLAIAMLLGAAVSIRAELPNVRLQDINGKTVQTGTISNGGKPVIISFWATWCKPCLRELKAIHEVYAMAGRDEREMISSSIAKPKTPTR